MALIGIINWVLTKYDLWIGKKYKDLFCKMCTRLRLCRSGTTHIIHNRFTSELAQCFSYQPQNITLLSPDRFCVLMLWIRLNRFSNEYAGGKWPKNKLHGILETFLCQLKKKLWKKKFAVCLQFHKCQHAKLVLWIALSACCREQRLKMILSVLFSELLPGLN